MASLTGDAPVGSGGPAAIHTGEQVLVGAHEQVLVRAPGAGGPSLSVGIFSFKCSGSLDPGSLAQLSLHVDFRIRLWMVFATHSASPAVV